MKSFVLLMLCGFLLLSSCSRDNSPETYLPIKEVKLPETGEESAQDPGELSHEEAIYLWVSQMQQENGLLESAEFTDFVSLYDNSLAALAFMQAGDLKKAERIFDYFENRMEEELLNGSGGLFQFRKKDGSGGSRTWLGDNAWLLIALNHYHDLTGSESYTILADNLENWIRSLQDTDGGLWGGFNEDGSQIPKVTEGIITAYNALDGFDDFHQGILDFLAEERWDHDEMVLITQDEDPNYRFALDLHSLGVLIFGDLPPTVLEQADRFRNTQMATLSGLELYGYGFDEDGDVIWLEGTAQMTLALHLNGWPGKKAALLEQMEKSLIYSGLAEGARGLPYTANHGSSFGAELLWDHADLTPALSSSIWYLFAHSGFNPMFLGASKKNGASQKFWLPSN